jgi:hypothetical protein
MVFVRTREAGESIKPSMERNAGYDEPCSSLAREAGDRELAITRFAG